KNHRKVLAATNTALEQRFRKQVGSRSEALKAREAFMTQVYNYFALPPNRGSLCSVALTAANEYLAATPDNPKAFAAMHLPRFETAFEGFFSAYEQYRIDSAAWDAKWGAQYGASQPGYVAVHGVTGPSIASSLVTTGAPTVVGEVLDPNSGARIPLIATMPDDSVSTPVVQPVPEGPQQ